MNTGMFEILWSGSIGDKAPEVRPDTRGTLWDGLRPCETHHGRRGIEGL